MLASDSDLQKLNFDVCLKRDREVFIFPLGEEKKHIWSGGRVANHQYSWRLRGRVPVLLETVELITANYSERKHIHQRAC